MFIDAPTDNLTLADPWERLAPELLDRFAKAPAANIGDVFDRLLVMDGGIRPFTAATRLVGTALPILTRAGDNLAIHRALDDAQPGDILVINGQGDLSRALIGDLIGEIMVSKGVLGAVIDGAVRDAETSPPRASSSSPAPPHPPDPSRTAPASSEHPSRSAASSSRPATSSSPTPTESCSCPATAPPGLPSRSTRSSRRKKRCAAGSSRHADSPGRGGTTGQARVRGAPAASSAAAVAAAARRAASPTGSARNSGVLTSTHHGPVKPLRSTARSRPATSSSPSPGSRRAARACTR
jgi:hypothetical protein